ncbi:anti-sigma factor family protein [Clostridium ganghwense]|uniref:DUF4367 domain-containing protein n=1 Tax=Clostridium ganghwense TaxID=312089 RepID=A0ABT4CK73_9CLOT|nr:DUF4367 domain-containing protein [Clostridium ganghwense]MCY6369455.1 DUF4367 domain-containing protein [Clostridium ganghwense]
MCYELEELQKIIDNTYEGDVNEVLSHIKDCPDCREKFQRLKQQDKLIESVLQSDMVIPPPRPINVCTVDFKEKNKRRIFNMSKKAKKWSAVAAGLVLCGGLVFSEPVRTKADELLKIFRMQEITSISISKQDISEINKIFNDGSGSKDIGNIVKVDVSSGGKNSSIKAPKEEADIKEKLSIDKVIKEPKGFVYERVSKAPKTDVTIKLDIDKTNDLLNYLGEKTKLPESLDKKPFTIYFNELVSYSFTQKTENKDEERKYIDVVKMNTPTVEIPKDVDEKQLIKSLFSINLLPQNLKEQFMKIDDLTSTIPVPYEAEYQTKEDITVNGQKAILIKEKNSNYLHVYFQDKENLYAINGNCTVDEILSFIEEMN